VSHATSVLAVPRQRLGRTTVLVPEQGDPAAGIDALQNGEEFVPMIRIDRRLVDMADEVRQEGRVEFVDRGQELEVRRCALERILRSSVL
jgi:hypothetical protein